MELDGLMIGWRKLWGLLERVGPGSRTPHVITVEPDDIPNSVFTGEEALALYKEATVAKQPIQIKPVVFNEFTQLIGGAPPIDPDTGEEYEFTEEQQEVRADLERILRTVQGLREKLDARQEEYRQLRIHVRHDIMSSSFQDWVSGRLSTTNYGS